MICIKKIMTDKVITISPDCSVRKAIEMMEHYQIECLPVVESHQLLGLITSRDTRINHPNRLVADAMSKKIITLSPMDSLWEAEKLLNQYQVKHLIITEDNRLVGVVTKAQLYAELGKYIDSLTGLHTADFLRHKAFELLYEGKEITIIFFDLDNFGTINKEFGHIIGDKILCKVAEILFNSIEPNTDYLCRYAGDEFSILTIKHYDMALDLTARITDALQNEDWPHNLKVTLSSGIAEGKPITGHKEDFNEVINRLINKASLASTRAKREKIVS
jgi:IMP dehydrogenase